MSEDLSEQVVRRNFATKEKYKKQKKNTGLKDSLCKADVAEQRLVYLLIAHSNDGVVRGPRFCDFKAGRPEAVKKPLFEASLRSGNVCGAPRP